MHCVQQHWHHHWEDYYGEAKAVRNQVGNLLANCQKIAPEDRTVEALAMAHQVLTKKTLKSRPKLSPKQLGFQGLWAPISAPLPLPLKPLCPPQKVC
jgi:hypothetical protein